MSKTLLLFISSLLFPLCVLCVSAVQSFSIDGVADD
jgi:hypothetical protein